MARQLTENQQQVLLHSATRGGWRGGWVWGCRSHTERIFEALTKKGLAVPVGDPRFPPCDYDLTPEGQRIATELWDAKETAYAALNEGGEHG